jgi:hypothetical protein
MSKSTLMALELFMDPPTWRKKEPIGMLGQQPHRAQEGFRRKMANLMLTYEPFYRADQSFATS